MYFILEYCNSNTAAKDRNMTQVSKRPSISHNGEKQFFLLRDCINNTLMLTLLPEMKLNNVNIPCDPCRNQSLKTTQHDLCPRVPCVPGFPSLPTFSASHYILYIFWVAITHKLFKISSSIFQHFLASWRPQNVRNFKVLRTQVLKLTFSG